jgi:hypothetical protein
MKKYCYLPVLTLYCWILSACTNSPDKYFDVAVLNSNMVSGFGNSSFEMELQSMTQAIYDKYTQYLFTFQHVP